MLTEVIELKIISTLELSKRDQFRIKGSSKGKVPIDLQGFLMKDEALSNQELKQKLIEFQEENLRLREMNESLGLMVENHNHLMLRFDKDWKIIFANKNYLDTFGLDENQAKKTIFTSLIHPDDQKRVKQSLDCLNRPPYMCKHEERAMTTAGWRWFEWSNKALLDPQDQILEFISVGNDVTQQKAAEKALEEKQEQLIAITENVYGSLWSVDKDYRLIIGNTNFYEDIERLYGRAISVGESALEGFSEDLKAEWKALYDRALSGEWFSLERERVIGKERRWDVCFFNPILDSSNNPVGVTIILNDITGRKESDERFRAIFKQSQAIMLLINPESGNIIDANEAAATFYGYSLEQLCSMNIRDINQLEGDLVKNQMVAVLQGQKKRFEFRHRIADGEIKDVDVYSTPISIRGEVFLFSIVHDVTDRIRSERELHRSKEELLRNIESKDRFFSIIAHDLLGPLGAIYKLGELMEHFADNGEYEKVVKYSKSIAESVQQSFKLVKNLLEWSRAQSGRLEVSPERIDLKEVVSSVRLVLQNYAASKNIQILSEIKQGHTIFADLNMVEAILRNLISNAIKYSRRGGTITLTSFQDEQESVISVKDTGVGIPRKMLPQLFRADSDYTTLGTQNEKGTGLGLILCKEFVAVHKGRIWAKSQEGSGSEFSFSIPNK